MAVNLVTGYAGQAHVTAADQALFNAGVCGPSKYVLQTNAKFDYTVKSATEISIGSGDLVNQGRHINIPINTEIDLTIKAGRSGYHRIDTIVMRYSKDSSSGTEKAELVVIEGAEVPTSVAASAPTIISGNIYEGDDIDDFVLYNVTIEELAIKSVTKMFSEIPTLASMWEFFYPVGAIYISTNDTSPAVLFGGTWTKISNKFLLSSGTKAAGNTGGSQSVTLGVNNIPKHSHKVNSHSHSIEKHNHTATVSEAGEHSHGTYYLRDYKINEGTHSRLGSSTENDGNFKTTNAGKHSHSVTISKAGPESTGSAAPSTNEVGGGEAVSIMPPYYVVNIWKRTA